MESNIKVLPINIFKAGCQTIVNPVNCVGVMGAGLAAQFKNRLPFEYYNNYVLSCKNRTIQPGTVQFWDNKSSQVKTAWSVLNFPTKNHWRDKSLPQYITDGLHDFVNKYRTFGITSIAFPLLGAGLGGLNKDWVMREMLYVLSPLDDISIVICGDL